MNAVLMSNSFQTEKTPYFVHSQQLFELKSKNDIWQRNYFQITKNEHLSREKLSISFRLSEKSHFVNINTDQC